MSTRRTSDGPLARPRGAGATRAAGAREARRARSADERQRRRFLVARLMESWLAHDPGLSLNDLSALLRDAETVGDERLGGFTVPSRASIARLLVRVRAAQAEQMALSERAFADRWGAHQPPPPIDPVEEYLKELCLLHPTASSAYLAEELGLFCAERGFPELSRSTINNRRAALNLEELQASAFGRRVAEMDGALKATIPTERPHDIWTLDELQVPVWIKVFDPVAGHLTPVRPWAVVVADNHSRVVVSYWIPTDREILSGGTSFGTEDVLAAVYGAAIPALAPPACRPFAGHLPGAVRMDAHKTHVQLKTLLRDHQVDAPHLPTGTPHRRGLIERLIGSLKRLCYDIPGQVDRYMPAMRLRLHGKKERTLSASHGERALRRHPIATEDLLDLEQFTEAFDQAVRRYHERTHRVIGMSPYGRYAERHDARRVRDGHDAITWLEPRRLTVGAGGVEHRGRWFTRHPRFGTPLAVGDRLVCYCDVGRRAIFARPPAKAGEDALMLLEPREVVAQQTDAAALVEDRNARLGAHSEAAAARQRDAFVRTHGPDAVARADAEAARAIAQSRTRHNRTEQARKQRREHARDAQTLAKRRGARSETPTAPQPDAPSDASASAAASTAASDAPTTPPPAAASARLSVTRTDRPAPTSAPAVSASTIRQAWAGATRSTPPREEDDDDLAPGMTRSFRQRQSGTT